MRESGMVGGVINWKGWQRGKGKEVRSRMRSRVILIVDLICSWDIDFLNDHLNKYKAFQNCLSIYFLSDYKWEFTWVLDP